MSERSLLMIPGPVEFEPEVLRALGRKTTSHLDPAFIALFARVLGDLRHVFLSRDAQPFVVAGSGTLAMEMAAINVVESGDRAVVVSTGYFGARMAEILRRLGAHVTLLGAPIGGAPALEDVERALVAQRPKVVAVTHVDTSTGVRAPVAEVCALAQRHGALSIVDGVCATGGEELQQEGWGVDLALTASQKALGVPPGLALVSAGPRALEAWRKRRTPVPSVYMDFGEWLPVMEAYAAEQPLYFATPPVNLVAALAASVSAIVAEGMAARVERHARMARAMRAAFAALELRPLPASEALTAFTMSALWYPDAVDPSFLGRAREEGVVLAGGLHPDARTKYFRIGHMGAIAPADVLATVGAVERALVRSGYRRSPGVAVAAAQRALLD